MVIDTFVSTFQRDTRVGIILRLPLLPRANAIQWHDERVCFTMITRLGTDGGCEKGQCQYQSDECPATAAALKNDAKRFRKRFGQFDVGISGELLWGIRYAAHQKTFYMKVDTWHSMLLCVWLFLLMLDDFISYRQFNGGGGIRLGCVMRIVWGLYVGITAVLCDRLVFRLMDYICIWTHDNSEMRVVIEMKC